MKGQLFAPDFQENQVPGGFALQNERMLKVALSGELMARQGAAVAWQGDVEFKFKGAGAKKMLKKMVTGEDLQLMTVSGNGDVFFGKYGEEVHILYLENETLSVNGANILAFDAGLEWDIKFNKGFGGVAGQGLVNVYLSGTGAVALTCNGTPVMLDVSASPTYCDPAAAVAWSGSISPDVKKTDNLLKSVIGRGSGETWSLNFSGQNGFVLVQPAEAYPWELSAQTTSSTGGAIGSLFN